MNWAGFTLLALNFLGLLITSHYHGKPRDGEWNVFVSLLLTGLTVWLYWCAGLFGR